MAGAIAAYRNVTNDPLWMIKIPILSIPLFLYFYDSKMITTIFRSEYIYLAILYVFYLGVSSVMIHRNIRNKVPILPSFFSVFSVMGRMIGCFIVSFVPTVLLIVSMFLIDNFFEGYEYFIIIILKIIAALILFPFICIPVVIYSVNGNLIDLFKVKNIFSLSGDFMSSFIGYIFQCTFLFGVFTFIIKGTFYLIWDNKFIGIPILYSIVSVMLFLMFFSWASDLYGQIIPEIPEKKRRDNALRETF